MKILQKTLYLKINFKTDRITFSHLQTPFTHSVFDFQEHRLLKKRDLKNLITMLRGIKMNYGGGIVIIGAPIFWNGLSKSLRTMSM